MSNRVAQCAQGTKTKMPVGLQVGPSLRGTTYSEIERQLMAHPLLAKWSLEFVRRSQGRHSEVLEYRRGTHPDKPLILVKHMNGARRPDQVKQAVIREFNGLVKIRKAAGPAFQENLPVPLAVLPEIRTIVLEKLPGTPLSSILRREANRLTGYAWRNKVGAIARLVGRWLREFHQATRQSPARYDARLYLADLAHQMSRCTANGLDELNRREIWGLASDASGKADGCPVPTAARHGDLIPQNILLHRGRISVVDFQNFSECDVVYEDIGTFVAYLAMLGGWAFYSRAALQAMIQGFRSGYGELAQGDLLDLYVVKAAVTIAAEFPARRGIFGVLRSPRVLQKRLLTIIFQRLENGKGFRDDNACLK